MVYPLDDVLFEGCSMLQATKILLILHHGVVLGLKLPEITHGHRGILGIIGKHGGVIGLCQINHEISCLFFSTSRINVIDLQAILMRIYLYVLMNRKLKPKAKEQGEEENLLHNKEPKQPEVLRIDLHWRILYFIPILFLGIAFQYGI